MLPTRDALSQMRPARRVSLTDNDSRRLTMKAHKLGYWITTALVALAFASGGVFDILKPPPVAATMAHLGYPVYVAVILGGWKLLGTAALLAPGLPRLKEWAYAGILFDLTGAA